MAVIAWDNVGERFYETGVDRGVLYLPDASGNYINGWPWNGLTTVTESPGGAEAQPQYADNIKYVNLRSAEDWSGTIEAFTYPSQFAVCDGVGVSSNVQIGQQSRSPFGLSYRSLLGNDLKANDYGYKIHLVYGCTVSPSEKAFATVNDSPEAINFSWDVSSTPAAVGTVGGVAYKPASTIVIDSSKYAAGALAALETILYGAAGVDPRLPSPADVIALFSGAVTTVSPTVPTFVAGTGVITIPSQTGVRYSIDGVTVTGTYTIASSGQSKVVRADPLTGYTFAANTVNAWAYTRS